MRFSLSSLAIAAAAVVSALFAAGAIFLFVLRSDIAVRGATLRGPQHRFEPGTGTRTVQLHLLGDGKVSYGDEEISLTTLGARVDLEGWDEHTTVQVLLVQNPTSPVGQEFVQLLELLGRRGVFQVRIQPSLSAEERQP